MWGWAVDVINPDGGVWGVWVLDLCDVGVYAPHPPLLRSYQWGPVCRGCTGSSEHLELK